MPNKQTLKFILDVLITKEKDYRKRNQLVQDSLWRLTTEKDRYQKEHQKYLGAITYLRYLLQDDTDYKFPPTL